MKSHSRSVQGLLVTMLLLAGPAAAEDPPKNHASGERFRYQAKGRRDPFVALVRDGKLVAATGARSAGPGPVLRGVLWDPGGQSIAMINEGEYRVGDMVGEYRILEIRKEAVVLANGGEPMVIQIDFGSPTPDPDAATGGGQP
jgi:hypothetical protein